MSASRVRTGRMHVRRGALPVATGPLRDVVGCHCSQCRRMTGHFMAATAARLPRLCAPTRAATAAGTKPPPRRGAVSAAMRLDAVLGRPGQDYISIAAGSSMMPRAHDFACHIFVADKGAYYQIEPGVPQIQDGNFSVPLPDP